jgi:lysyl-tRNA synthetase, class I
MFWADRIIQDIISQKKYSPYWVDDMFTPSGFAHIGSLRGPLVHDIVYRSLIDAGQKSKTTYVFNDFDPIDGLPNELSQMSPYLGFPLRTAPSPVKGFTSFAEYFTLDFQKVLRTLGVKAEFYSSWDMYHDGKFDEVIKIALNSSEKILDIYQRVSGSKKREKGWLPLQVICEKCGKLGTTRVHDWDGKNVRYTCEPTMVTWAVGCGYSGNISPFGGNAKLPWKVDWPAHWKVMGVTIEGAGKDHSSSGGSRDIAKALCTDVFHIQNPYNLPYEFFLIGGKKMSSSKGLGLKARDLTILLPPSIARFLFVRTEYKQAIEIDPLGTMAIPDLFDEYDRSYLAYIHNTDPMLSRAFELSQITNIPSKEEIFLPRFRDVANYIQLGSIDILKKFQEIKGKELTLLEKNILNERIQYAKVWIESYAPDEYRYHMTDVIPEIVKDLSDDQKKFLSDIIPLLELHINPDDLQFALYECAKKSSKNPKYMFPAIYMTMIGKTHGPKAAWLLTQYDKKLVIERLQLAIEYKITIKRSKVQKIERPDYFTIDPYIKKQYPTISVGIALINGANVQMSDENLEKEKKELLENIKTIKTEDLQKYSEILSYRRLYKDMGIDWHSRRPSPEALLRRVILGKELYKVNTCVDAYNIVVMKHRISVGAFDSDTIHFPTILRIAQENDEILLLGDSNATKYTNKEIAYYDQNGGYNIDFNYRDAQRTAVTGKTKNIWINVDGVYDITPDMVEKSLNESVEIIRKYCGGTVVFQGMVTGQ